MSDKKLIFDKNIKKKKNVKLLKSLKKPTKLISTINDRFVPTRTVI